MCSSQTASGGLQLSKKQVKAMNRKELCAHLRSIGVCLLAFVRFEGSQNVNLTPSQASCDGNKKVLMRRVLEYTDTATNGNAKAATDPDSANAAPTASATSSDPTKGADGDADDGGGHDAIAAAADCEDDHGMSDADTEAECDQTHVSPE